MPASPSKENKPSVINPYNCVCPSVETGGSTVLLLTCSKPTDHDARSTLLIPCVWLDVQYSTSIRILALYKKKGEREGDCRNHQFFIEVVSKGRRGMLRKEPTDGDKKKDES